LSRCSTTVRVAAPCRADLAGGTLDIWPVGLLHPGSLTVNMALDVEVVLEVDLAGEQGRVDHSVVGGSTRRLRESDCRSDLTAALAFTLAPGGGVRVRVERQAPYRSGIGGSSSYGIALATALYRLRDTVVDEARIVALVRDLEARILGVPTGEQDHWAAVRGGVLALHLDPGGSRVESLEVDGDWLEGRTSVFFTGIRHRSGMVNWQVLRRRLDGDRRTVDAFAEISSAAGDCRAGLLAGDDDAVADALRREWGARRRLAPEVCPPELGALVATALETGASAAKACGAGGGGSLLLWHPVGAADELARKLESVSDGGRVIASGVFELGCRVLDRPTPGS
jgi:D-glycero-alpha-D-manno-heptose-7-phosphate kinase